MDKKKRKSDSRRGSSLGNAPSMISSYASGAVRGSRSRENTVKRQNRRPLTKTQMQSKGREKPSTSREPAKDKKVDKAAAESGRDKKEIAKKESSDSIESVEVIIGVEKFPTVSTIALNKPNIRDARSRDSSGSDDDSQTRSPGRKCLNFYSLCLVSLIFLSGHLVTFPQ